MSLFDTEFVLAGVFPKELSKDFHKAFELRQITDYKVMAVISTAKAEEILQKAQGFVEAVRRYLWKE
jgi:uncharacterized protein (UPF0332 family)